MSYPSLFEWLYISMSRRHRGNVAHSLASTSSSTPLRLLWGWLLSHGLGHTFDKRDVTNSTKNKNNRERLNRFWFNLSHASAFLAFGLKTANRCVLRAFHDIPTPQHGFCWKVSTAWFNTDETGSLNVFWLCIDVERNPLTTVWWNETPDYRMISRNGVLPQGYMPLKSTSMLSDHDIQHARDYICAHTNQPECPTSMLSDHDTLATKQLTKSISEL